MSAVLKIERQWAMPCADTLSIKPVEELARKYLAGLSVDPFARDCKLATYTNDINPDTTAEYHMWADEFLKLLIQKGVKAKAGIFDPPYSSRQVKEVYAGMGRQFFKEDNQNCVRWTKERDLMAELIVAGGYVLSLGWNSTGMGKSRGFEKVEILLVNHGSAHNDTICLVERKL